MYSPFQLGLKYLRYFFTAFNGKGHGIHSPFVFDLVINVLNDKKKYPAYNSIESIRKKMLQDKTVLTVEDFGAGSTTGLTKQRTIQQIASSSLKKPKYARLLFRLVNYFHSKNILELGTSLGVTTAYLASADQEARVVTMEGAASIASVAASNFKELQLNNIECVIGNFDEKLSSVVNRESPAFSFVFIDGNHRKEPALNYFQQILEKSDESTVFVFDDIHWSKEMEEAWEEIKQHPSVTLTIDLFFIGLVFLRKQQKEKEHFVIRF